MKETSYTVPEMSCDHCRQAVSSELERVEGVESVAVDLATKRVVVRGERLEDSALRAAIERAGYEAA
jgi:copper chaperone